MVNLIRRNPALKNSRSASIFAALILLCAPLSACRAEHQNPTIVATPPPPPQFTDTERTSVVSYWTEPGRYLITAPNDTAQAGVWQVRLTPEGSLWLHTYQRTIGGKDKIPPSQTVKVSASSPYAAWETWVTAKIAYDRWLAQQAADSANSAIGITAKKTKYTATEAPYPGPIPTDLLAACGNPPSFANAVTPLNYRIRFDDGDFYGYTDNPRMGARYAYYRFPKGINTGGTETKDLPEDERSELFKEAGLSPGEQHIFEAISKQEGGFDAVQSYDTGFVSIGFIQFITASDGKTDLSHVLMQEKTDTPSDYEQDFRRFGIDVRPDLSMVVIDPVTGAELSGQEAVMKVIEDKRLMAVFQRAGRKKPFRIAQIKVAKSFYWPTDDPVSIRLPDGSQLTCKVGDIIHSEAGLAVLLDRKINTGNWRPLEDVVARTLVSHKCPGKSATEVCPFEKEIVAAMKYRFDALSDPTLEKP